MEEQFKKEDQILKKLIVEAGPESPSHEFKSKLMDAIREKAEQKVVYRPLITRKLWLGVAVLLAAVVLFSIFFPSAGLGSLLGIDVPVVDTELALPKFEFSKVFVYGMIFLSLFLFQIPFLKKFVEARSNLD